MRPRYAELLTDALKLPANPESYLDDIDGSFYVTGYLRSWAFEAQLRDFLRCEFGNDWFARRDAGDLLRELVVARPGPDRRRAAARRHGRPPRDGVGRRADPRRPRRVGRRRFPSGESGEPGPWARFQLRRLTIVSPHESIILIVPVQDCNQKQNKI